MPGAVKSRRGYDSPRRREQAAETRRKILDAAGELFARDGYAAVAMPAIADRAGVALKTVYLAFGTKAGVLHGLWDVRLGGDDQPIPVTERPWYRQLLEGDDPVALVRAAARQSRETKDRVGDLLRVIREAAVTEPALAGLWDRIETEFRAVLGGFAERLAALGALAPGVDVALATDLLWTLNHPDTWYLLIRGCGWSADAYEQWVGDTLVAQLLGLSGRLTGRGPGQDGEGGPLAPPAFGLGLVDLGRGEHRVGAHHQVEYVGQAVRGVDAPPAAGFGTDAEARGGGLVGIDGRLGGLVRRAPDAELLLVPQVDAGLVADLHRGGQTCEQLVPGPDDRVLGVPGQVRGVEVGEVVVEDARLRRLAADHVPHRLVQAPRDQVPAGQVQRGRPGQHLGQRAVAAQRLLEPRQLLVEGKPSVTGQRWCRVRAG